MIEIKNVSKSFDHIKATDKINLTIEEGSVMGLVGTNGAGKSTLLRMIAGVYLPDEGEILVDDAAIWNDAEVKKKIYYISDDQYFFPNATPMDMADFYKVVYPDFDEEEFLELSGQFSLETDRQIQTFSKGMKKQLSILLGICTKVPYLLCDETFDGLDPVMRQAVKSLFVKEMETRHFTPVIASHNLRELEDICDHIGLLHKGGVLLSKDLETMKSNIHKIQCVLPLGLEKELKDHLEILQLQRRGKLITMTVRGEEKEIMKRIEQWNPVFCECLPLSLEKIFISETEVVGYDVKTLIF